MRRTCDLRRVKMYLYETAPYKFQRGVPLRAACHSVGRERNRQNGRIYDVRVVSNVRGKVSPTLTRKSG